MPDQRWALTIDDGPSEVTSELLRLLDEQDARASFFVLGRRAAKRPDAIGEMVAGGHAVFAHGWSHRRFDTLSDAAIRGELERTESVLQRFRPTPEPYFVRLPYGAGADDARVRAAVQSWRPTCEIVGWNVTPAEWKLHAVDLAAACARAVTRSMRGADLAGSIVLLHDTPIGVPRRRAARVSVEVLKHWFRAAAERGITMTGL